MADTTETKLFTPETIRLWQEMKPRLNDSEVFYRALYILWAMMVDNQLDEYDEGRNEDGRAGYANFDDFMEQIGFRIAGGWSAVEGDPYDVALNRIIGQIGFADDVLQKICDGTMVNDVESRDAWNESFLPLMKIVHSSIKDWAVNERQEDRLPWNTFFAMVLTRAAVEPAVGKDCSVLDNIVLTGLQIGLKVKETRQTA